MCNMVNVVVVNAGFIYIYIYIYISIYIYIYIYISQISRSVVGLIGKDSDAGRDWGQEEKGTTEDEMAGWHHRLDGREFE